MHMSFATRGVGSARAAADHLVGDRDSAWRVRGPTPNPTTRALRTLCSPHESWISLGAWHIIAEKARTPLISVGHAYRVEWEVKEKVISALPRTKAFQYSSSGRTPSRMCLMSAFRQTFLA